MIVLSVGDPFPKAVFPGKIDITELVVLSSTSFHTSRSRQLVSKSNGMWCEKTWMFFPFTVTLRRASALSRSVAECGDARASSIAKPKTGPNRRRWGSLGHPVIWSNIFFIAVSCHKGSKVLLPLPAKIHHYSFSPLLLLQLQLNIPPRHNG